MNEETMSKYEAYTAMRVFMRLEQQMNRALDDRRFKDGAEIARIFGAWEYRIFGGACFTRSIEDKEAA